MWERHDWGRWVCQKEQRQTSEKRVGSGGGSGTWPMQRGLNPYFYHKLKDKVCKYTISEIYGWGLLYKYVLLYPQVHVMDSGKTGMSFTKSHGYVILVMFKNSAVRNSYTG